MLQPLIHVNTQVFNEVKKRSREDTYTLMEYKKSKRNLKQVLIVTPQQGVSPDLFEPASWKLIEYWPRFFPYFKLREAFYEISYEGDFSLFMSYSVVSKTPKRATRDMKERVPKLFGLCLLEIDKEKLKRKDDELRSRELKIKDLEQILEKTKVEAEESISEERGNMDRWLGKFQELETEKVELEKVAETKADHIGELKEEIINLQNELELAKNKLSKTNSEAYLKQLEAEKEEIKIAVEEVKKGSEKENEGQLFYGPGMDEDSIVTYRKRDFEKKIKEMFVESKSESKTKRVRVLIKEFYVYVKHIDFLEYHWSRAKSKENAELNEEFLRWCEPYVEELPKFLEEIGERVVKNTFVKKFYYTDNETLHLLKAYDFLSRYLEIYSEHEGIENDENSIKEEGIEERVSSKDIEPVGDSRLKLLS